MCVRGHGIHRNPGELSKQRWAIQAYHMAFILPASAATAVFTVVTTVATTLILRLIIAYRRCCNTASMKLLGIIIWLWLFLVHDYPGQMGLVPVKPFVQSF